LVLGLIQGKTILVTGAAGGIGSVLCRVLASGNRLLALDVDAGGLEALVEDLRGRGHDVRALVADVRDREALATAVGRCGPVDILVNNAGGSETPSFGTMTEARWQRDLDVNLTGAYHAFEAVRPGMEERRAGVVVNVGSANALTAMGHPAYSAAKAGLISLTQSLALEFGPKGIRANIVLPGTVATAAWETRAARDPAIFERLRALYPLRRIVGAEDVAHAVAFLASDYASCITGAVLGVDCGLLAGSPMLAHELTQEDF